MEFLAKTGDRDVVEMLQVCGKKAIYYLGKVANHPLTKWAVGGGIAYLLGKEVMENDYSATADLGFARFSLSKNTTTKE